jgi:hypothetical protein
MNDFPINPSYKKRDIYISYLCNFAAFNITVKEPIADTILITPMNSVKHSQPGPVMGSQAMPATSQDKGE